MNKIEEIITNEVYYYNKSASSSYYDDVGCGEPDQYEYFDYNGKKIYYGWRLYIIRKCACQITNTKVLDEYCGFNNGTCIKLEHIGNLNSKFWHKNFSIIKDRLIKVNEVLDDILNEKLKCINEYNNKMHRYVTLKITKS